MKTLFGYHFEYYQACHYIVLHFDINANTQNWRMTKTMYLPQRHD